MLRIALIFGGIAGLICGGMFFLTIPQEGGEMNFDNGQLIGYTTMIIALSSIFFAVKQYRDKELNGEIKFIQAFLMGLAITVVAGFVYVFGWEIYYTNYASDFGDQYVEYMREQMAEAGKSAEEINTTMAEQEEMMVLYKENRAVRMGITFLEIFPVGLIISLIVALIYNFGMKNKEPAPGMA
ncbi:MAG: DUF4199 domain-containing protein [Bacteroidota bacterium]